MDSTIEKIAKIVWLLVFTKMSFLLGMIFIAFLYFHAEGIKLIDYSYISRLFGERNITLRKITDATIRLFCISAALPVLVSVIYVTTPILFFLIFLLILRELIKAPQISYEPNVYTRPTRKRESKCYRDPKGYLRFKNTNKPVHRWIMEKELRRKLNDYEVVHHRDGNKINNRPSNLIVCTPEEHNRMHQENLIRYNSWYEPS
jgi:hypothetical protein